MGPLGNIVQKELLEMVRDPKLLLGMIVVPLLLFPIMGAAIGSTREAAEKGVAEATVGFFSMDATDGNGTYSVLLEWYLGMSNITCRNITAPDEQHAVGKATAEVDRRHPGCDLKASLR